MKSKAFYFFLVLCWITPFYAQQSNKTLLGFNSPLSKDQTDSSKQVNWMEVIEERSIFSSSFRSEDGQVKIEYSKTPINYFNKENKLIPIDPTLTELSQNSSVWAALNQPYPTYLYHKGSFAITLGGNSSMRVGEHFVVNGKEIEGVRVQVSQNRVSQHYNELGFSRILDFFENAVEYSYILSQAPSSLSENLNFDERLDLPTGFTASLEVSSNF